MKRTRRHSRQRLAAFTLIEALISLAVIAGLLVAVLALFDFTNKLARVQTNVADMQQSQRIAQNELARYLRMSGRGGLPLAQCFKAGTTSPNPFKTGHFEGAAMDVLDGVGPSQHLTADSGSPLVLEGSDVLTVRGVFNTPIYQVAYTDPTTFTLTGSPPTGGTIRLSGLSPAGFSQDLKPFEDAIKRAEALILVSAENDLTYAVVELDPGGANSVTIDATDPKLSTATIAFKIVPGSDYDKLSVDGTFPMTELNRGGTTGAVSMVGILEEYKYYIRDDRTNPSNPVTHLTRARLYPNTGKPWNGSDQELQADVADNIMDLQVALGFDRDNLGTVTETKATPQTDEWLFNGKEDDAGAAPWPTAATDNLPRLFYVRVNTLARTERRDPQYQAPQVQVIENHGYTLNPSDETDTNGRTSLMFRRRLLQTLVEVRNIS